MTLDILEIGPLDDSHTQLNVCEKEEFPCFLYLIQIFVTDLLAAKTARGKSFVFSYITFFLFIFRMDTEKHDAEVGESLLPNQNGV